jgi:O-acetyl-ADP-ribose deacetylase (regulator of RNase III)
MIKYVKGDATRPWGEGPKILAHCCNDEGRWGAGFVKSLTRRWPDVENAYRLWYRTGLCLNGRVQVVGKFGLGSVQFIEVEPQLWVANVIGQHGIMKAGNKHPIRYEAIHSGLFQVNVRARINNATIHMPRMGAGLAGGDWSRIEEIIQKVVRVSVTVYSLG